MAPPPLALVLYGDPEHRYAPVGDFFYSAEAKELVSRALGASSAEVDSLYCPRALEPVAQSDADAAFGRSDACADCPRCGTTLRAVRDGTWHYACASCAWTSRAVDLEDGEDDLHLAMKLAQREAEAPRAAAFAAALARLRASGFGGAGAEGASRDDDAEARALRDPLPEPLEARLRQPLAPDARQRLAPTRPCLASLVTCRRVADVEAGRAGILRKPRPHPLDGDSSAGGAGGRPRQAASAPRPVGGRRPGPPLGARDVASAVEAAPSHAGADAGVRAGAALAARRRGRGLRGRPLRAEPVARRRDDGNHPPAAAAGAEAPRGRLPRDAVARGVPGVDGGRRGGARAARRVRRGFGTGRTGAARARRRRPERIRGRPRGDGRPRDGPAPVSRGRGASFGAAVVWPWPGGLASEAWEVARGCACLF